MSAAPQRSARRPMRRPAPPAGSPEPRVSAPSPSSPRRFPSIARPLGIVGFAFVGSVILAFLLPLAGILIAGSICLVAFLSLLLFYPRPAVMLLSLACFAAFLVSGVWTATRIEPLSNYNNQIVHLRGTVVDDAVYATSARCTVAVTGGDLPAGTRVYVWIYDRENLPALWDTLEADVSLSAVPRQSGYIFPPGYTDGVYVQANVKGTPTLASGTAPWYTVFDTLRGTLSARIQNAVPGDEGALIAGICLGDKSALPSYIKDDFRGAGLSHLVVVGGLHLSLVCGALFFLLERLRVRRRVAAAIVIPLVLLFMALTGFAPSVTRAGVMLLTVLAGNLFRRRADALNSLGFALLLIALFDFPALLDGGLWLSFTATLGLLVVLPRLTDAAQRLPLVKRSRAVRYVVNAVCVTLAAMALMTPVAVLLFGSTSLTAPLSNLLAVPLGGAVLITGFLALPFSGAAAFLPARLAAHALLWVAHTLGNTPLSFIPLGSIPVQASLFAAVALMALGVRFRRKALAVLCSVVIVAAAAGGQWLLLRRYTEIDVLYAGDGAALLIDSRTLIVDDAIASSVVNALSARQIPRLDTVIVTDTNASAISRIGTLLLALPIQQVYYTDGRYTYQVLAFAPGAQLLPAVWEQGNVRLEQGGRLTVGDTRLLLCAANEDIPALPAAWRDVGAVIYAGAPPALAAGLVTTASVVSCTAQTMTTDAVVHTALQGTVFYTVQQSISLYTKGRGDISMRVEPLGVAS